MTWREESLRIIDKRFKISRETYPSSVTDDEILRQISVLYYPFGPRKNHPYQAWLGAMKDYKAKLKRGKMPDIDGPLFEVTS
jgi:hypothetical protein